MAILVHVRKVCSARAYQQDFLRGSTSFDKRRDTQVPCASRHNSATTTATDCVARSSAERGRFGLQKCRASGKYPSGGAQPLGGLGRQEGPFCTGSRYVGAFTAIPLVPHPKHPPLLRGNFSQRSSIFRATACCALPMRCFCLTLLVASGVPGCGSPPPTATQPNPKVFRMRFALPNAVVAKSRFWYFISRVHKMKRASGEILGCHQVRLFFGTCFFLRC